MRIIELSSVDIHPALKFKRRLQYTRSNDHYQMPGLHLQYRNNFSYFLIAVLSTYPESSSNEPISQNFVFIPGILTLMTYRDFSSLKGK